MKKSVENVHKTQSNEDETVSKLYLNMHCTQTIYTKAVGAKETVITS